MSDSEIELDELISSNPASEYGRNRFENLKMPKMKRTEHRQFRENDSESESDHNFALANDSRDEDSSNEWTPTKFKRENRTRRSKRIIENFQDTSRSSIIETNEETPTRFSSTSSTATTPAKKPLGTDLNEENNNANDENTIKRRLRINPSPVKKYVHDFPGIRDGRVVLPRVDLAAFNIQMLQKRSKEKQTICKLQCRICFRITSLQTTVVPPDSRVTFKIHKFLDSRFVQLYNKLSNFLICRFFSRINLSGTSNFIKFTYLMFILR